jgi:hypothetical protein
VLVGMCNKVAKYFLLNCWQQNIPHVLCLTVVAESKIQILNANHENFNVSYVCCFWKRIQIFLKNNISSAYSKVIPLDRFTINAWFYLLVVTVQELK